MGAGRRLGRASGGRCALAMAGALLLAACGDDRLLCTAPADWPAGKPRIDCVRYLQQGPQDPYALSFLLDFFDSDGDLGGGSIHMLVSGKERGERTMQDIFDSQTTPIAPSAIEGEFEVVVRLSDTIPAGDEIDISFFLEDAMGRLSNRPSLVLYASFSGGGS